MCGTELASQRILAGAWRPLSWAGASGARAHNKTMSRVVNPAAYASHEPRFKPGGLFQCRMIPKQESAVAREDDRLERAAGSDNGSKSVNDPVATLLEKLRAEFTKPRPRHSNDNALVETQNGTVGRKPNPPSPIWTSPPRRTATRSLRARCRKPNKSWFNSVREGGRKRRRHCGERLTASRGPPASPVRPPARVVRRQRRKVAKEGSGPTPFTPARGGTSLTAFPVRHAAAYWTWWQRWRPGGSAQSGPGAPGQRRDGRSRCAVTACRSRNGRWARSCPAAGLRIRRSEVSFSQARPAPAPPA